MSCDLVFACVVAKVEDGGRLLCPHHPPSPCVAALGILRWRQLETWTGLRFIVSLRDRADEQRAQVNCAVLAQVYGGGGQRTAAGFQYQYRGRSLEELWDLVA